MAKAVEKRSKLNILADSEGIDLDNQESLGEILMDSVQPGICMNPGCDYTTDSVEPDQNRGYCEICNTQTVKSISMLMGII